MSNTAKWQSLLACVEMRTYSIDCNGMRPQTYAEFADNVSACQDSALNDMDI